MQLLDAMLAETTLLYLALPTHRQIHAIVSLVPAWPVFRLVDESWQVGHWMERALALVGTIWEIVTTWAWFARGALILLLLVTVGFGW